MTAFYWIMAVQLVLGYIGGALIKALIIMNTQGHSSSAFGRIFLVCLLWLPLVFFLIWDQVRTTYFIRKFGIKKP